jgi:C4-dicarboxylate-specific signal transduction histidine kinase
MPALAITEVTNPDQRFLNMLSDGREQRSLPAHPVKRLRPRASRSQDRDGRPERSGVVQGAAPCGSPEDAPDSARSELAHAARIRSLGLLTASIAHEVNQPLAAIVTNGETCLRWLDRAELDVERIREFTRRVIADARRASEIVDRVSAMAKRQVARHAPLPFNEIVEEALVFLRHDLQSRDIAVSLDITPDLPPVVGDRTQLQQVVVNLLINAAQATTESAGEPRRICIRTSLSDPNTVSCFIEDSGTGIEPAHLPHLFDSFFTTKDGGIGMGLSISLSIIEAHGGQIQADNNSILGGARFSFSLPTKGTA